MNLINLGIFVVDWQRFLLVAYPFQTLSCLHQLVKASRDNPVVFLVSQIQVAWD